MTGLSLQQFLPYRLSITASLVSEAIARVYAELYALTIPEWRLIAVTAEAGQVTQAEVGHATRMDKVTVSRAAIALVGRGLLERRPNPQDKRSHLLVLSEAGAAMYEAIAPRALAMEAEIFGRFEAVELEVLRGLLGRIDAAVVGLAEGFGLGG